ncbi:NPCBM/NEW2 domain-containing protein [Streptomyces sp. NPDC048330]|uniref:NPCBM/NEW2 domain-containing protein n=1 Tax=Streptomyces sp. NPDC048330 TaxID=3365533 RepID=UPI00371B05FF
MPGISYGKTRAATRGGQGRPTTARRLLVLGLLMALAACSPGNGADGGRASGDKNASATAAPSASASAVSGTVAADGLTLKGPRGLGVRVEGGALPVGMRVAVSEEQGAPVEQLGTLARSAPVWDVHADVPPSGEVTLTMPYDPAAVPEGARARIVTYDPETKRWYPVATEADAETRVLTGTIEGFSLKTWIVDRADDVAGAASWAEYQAGRLLGTRAARPDCAGRPKVPEWVKDVTTVADDNAQIFACGHGEGDRLVLEIVNNRGYPVSVVFDRPYAAVRSSVWTDGVSGVFQQVGAVRASNRVPLISGGSATVVFDRPARQAGVIQGWARRDTAALALWLTSEVFLAAGGDVPMGGGKSLGLASVDCLGRTSTSVWAAADRTADADAAGTAAELAGLRDCLAQSLETGVRAWGVDPSRAVHQSADSLRLPREQLGAVKALRFLYFLGVAEWSLQAGDLLVNDGTREAGLVDLSVRWRHNAVVDAMPLFDLTPTDREGGSSGQHVDAVLAGEGFPRSTGAWVGCEGEPAGMTYTLNGRFTALVAKAGLRPHTPDGIVAEMVVETDGKPRTTVRVTRATAASVEIDLTGVDTLRLTAEKVQGTCGTSDTPYGAWGDAVLLVAR